MRNENKKSFWKGQNGKLRYGRITLISTSIIVMLWLASWGGVNLLYDDSAARGTFGDMFGAVNALFSGLAFSGLIITLVLQREELELQRAELRDTREVFTMQKAESVEQNKTLRRQRFENTFFNMLTLQQEITNNLFYNCPDGADPFEAKGRQLFNAFYCSKKYFTGDDLCGIKGLVARKGIASYGESSDINVFDHYFRHLYRILKYIAQTELIEDTDRYDYACIVRAQLSDYELLMLFYNCLNNAGIEKFKPLIEEFALLKNLRVELLADQSHINEYNNGAYAKS